MPETFLDRLAETDELDQLVADVAAGRSRVIVLRGEAGIGKTALLRRLAQGLQGWYVAAAAPVETEMELAYSSLHQLCSPMLNHLEDLPGPQRDALTTVFGLGAGAAPDGFLVGVATLTLFTKAADRQPMLCIIDDAQWLDRASAVTLSFVARRMVAERIALVCAARTDSGDPVLVGLPELPIRGLPISDARALLLENVRGPIDAAIFDRIITESHGNPLALLELPRAWDALDAAGGLALLGAPVAGKIEQSYARRLADLPPATQLLVLTAAAEPLGDLVLLHRAAATLDLDVAVAAPAAEAGLLRLAGGVEFAHPLVRSAAYRSATAADRRRVHHALAEATDPDNDPDRRAWHRAHATPGPDEEVADELERSAGRARARGGVAAAAAFLRRAATLTPDSAARAERALSAAEASFQAGSFDTALALVAMAEAAQVDEIHRSRAALVRGYVALASGSAADGARLLLEAGKRQDRFDPEMARETYVAALGAGITAAGRYGGSDGVLLDVCAAVRAHPAPAGATKPLHALLEGLALLLTEGHAAAAPVLRPAARSLTAISTEEVLRWGWVATGASTATWDYEGFVEIADRQVKLLRELGALAQLPLHLSQLAIARAWAGDLSAAASLAAESDSLTAATGSHIPPFGLLRVRALQGREAEASDAIAKEIAQANGAQAPVTHARWAAAVLNNGLARFDEASMSAARASGDAFDPWTATWALPELVEAAARAGETEVAAVALERLIATTRPAGTDWALGVEARCRALLNDRAAADELYREAIDRLGRTPLRPELARAQLLYGEWLRREGRRQDARAQLRTARETFEAIGMEAFAARTRRALVATGETARKRGDETRDELTPQEDQIARLARDGLSNQEIGAQLFISARTVEWHLRKIFTKLGISSRRQLGSALAMRSHPPASS